MYKRKKYKLFIEVKSLFSCNIGSGTDNGQQGRENTDPLPNPWAPNSTQSPSSPSSTTIPSGTGTTPQQPPGTIPLFLDQQ